MSKQTPKQLDPVDNPVAEYFQPTEGVDWRVDRWELMAAEFTDLKREDLADFHILVRDRISSRSWTIVRRLFGIQPKFLPLNGNPDDYRAHSRKELATLLNLSDGELEAEIEVIRAAWRRRKREEHVAAESTKPIQSPTKAGQATVFTEEQNDDLLIRYGFDPTMFDLPSRDKKSNAIEKAWFCKRVREWEPLFTKTTMTEQLAGDTLTNELRLRREKNALWALDKEEPGGQAKKAARDKRKSQIADRIKELQQLHTDQLDAINEHAPWFNVSDAQISATGAVAQMIEAIQEWEANADSTLLDGVFTSTELQVMVRTSKQIDEPRYRWGWVMYINESKKWLWDPRAKNWMKERDLARFDNGFKAGVKAYNEVSEARVVDLEADGPEGQYDDLKESNEKH